MTALYRIFFRKKYKIISICDDSADMIKNGSSRHIKACEKATKYLDGIILCNYLAQEIYQEKYLDIKTFVMPIIQNEQNFFENKELVIMQAKKIAEKEHLVGKRVFLYVGRISPEKNPLYLLKSFVANHEENPENILYIIGDYIFENQSYNDEIDKYIASHHAEEYIREI